MKRYYRRIAPLLSGNHILPSPAHYEISTPHLLSTIRPVSPSIAPRIFMFDADSCCLMDNEHYLILSKVILSVYASF